jgi:hypothetical protein
MTDPNVLDIIDLKQTIINFTIEISTPQFIFNDLKFVSKDFNNYINTLCIYIYQKKILPTTEYFPITFEYWCSTQSKIMEESCCAIYMKNYKNNLRGTFNIYRLEYHWVEEKELDIFAKSIKQNISELKLIRTSSGEKLIRLYTTSQFNISKVIDLHHTNSGYIFYTIIDMVLEIYIDHIKYPNCHGFENIELTREKCGEYYDFYYLLLKDNIKRNKYIFL